MAAMLMTGLGARVQPAHAATPSSAANVIGYVFAGTYASNGSGHGAVETLAVRPNYTLAAVRQTVLPAGLIFGMGLVHTQGGISLYAEASTTSVGVGTIYQFSVNRTTGALTAKKPSSFGRVSLLFSGQANNLFAYDGYGQNGKGVSALYAAGCPDSSCNDPGIAHYKVNPATGRLSLAAPIVPETSRLLSMSLFGNHLDVLFQGKQDQYVADAEVINPHTGSASAGPQFPLGAVGNPPRQQSASIIAAGPGRLALYEAPLPHDPAFESGVGVRRVTGNRIGGLMGAAPEHKGESISSLAFSNNALIAGEYGSTPGVQVFGPQGSGTERFVDLAKRPFNFPTGNEFDPNFATQAFTLGRGVYIGAYQGGVAEATDGPGKKLFAINPQQPVGPVGDTRAMAGYLLP
jgi:hypothetical protein